MSSDASTASIASSAASIASSEGGGPGPGPGFGPGDVPPHAHMHEHEHPPIGTCANGKLYLGCKKEGCNGILILPSSTKHGASYQCGRCLNKQKYCYDCQQLYINFRRHRTLGHELYEFQRKRQVRHCVA
jgi:hypothetical protein